MRPIHLFAVLAFVGMSGLRSRAEDALEVVERGMKARCDKPETLKKQQCEIITMQGKMLWLEDQKEKESTAEIKVDWPSSFRWDRDVNLLQGNRKIIFSIFADKGWQQIVPAPPAVLGLVQVEECRMEIYGRWLGTLYPLTDRALTLTLLKKDNKVDGEEVAVVKVSLRNRPDVYLSFSRKSNHLLKIAYKALEGGIELRKEHQFSDYKEFEGIKLPTKLIDFTQPVNSPAPTKIAEWTITGYKFLPKLDAKIFEQPPEKK
jgi:hypothetical protein